MDRLTETNNYIGFMETYLNVDCKECQYKDAGECEEFKDECKAVADFKGFVKNMYSKLKEYEELEEQGRLLRLPCKVGDMVWDIDFGRPCSYEVTGFSFGSLNDDDWEEEKVLDQIVVYYTNSNGSITGTFAVSEIGKTVFLTRQEAEDKLAEMEGKNG